MEIIIIISNSNKNRKMKLEPGMINKLMIKIKIKMIL
jgi:hypothetical protein